MFLYVVFSPHLSGNEEPRGLEPLPPRQSEGPELAASVLWPREGTEPAGLLAPLWESGQRRPRTSRIVETLAASSLSAGLHQQPVSPERTLT